MHFFDLYASDYVIERHVVIICDKAFYEMCSELENVPVLLRSRLVNLERGYPVIGSDAYRNKITLEPPLMESTRQFMEIEVMVIPR